MTISDFMLQDPDVKLKMCDKDSGYYDSGLPDTIIIHYTAGASAASSIKTLTDPNVKASAHIVVDKQGKITQLVPFNKIAWHAGESSYQGRHGFNKYSLGIEIDNAGELLRQGEKYVTWFGAKVKADDVVEAVHRNENHASYWQAYTDQQITTVQSVCKLLIETYGISTILGHEEIAPRRKKDPGPAFPLDKLRETLLDHDRSGDRQFTEPDIHPENAGIVTASKLNIRSNPGLTSPTISQPLHKGTVVDILDESHGWLKVDIRTIGWVKKDYIKT